MKTYIGIDNGVGTIGFINEIETHFCLTPLYKCQDYTKRKKMISRLDVRDFKRMMVSCPNPQVMMERPMVNPKRFFATETALRIFEAQLSVLSILRVGVVYIDSKEWQKHLLPSGIKGSPELKRASMDKGLEMYPKFEDLIRKHGDADGILIAHYFNTLNTNNDEI